MMNEITEKQNRRDHALAQLLVHAPRNNAGSGAEVSIEELAMLSEGKLSEQRRQEVLGQLDSNPALYETWQASLEMAEYAQSVQPESVSESKSIAKQARPSLVEQISHFVSDLFSWQGAFATSFGIALGVLLVSQTGLNSENDPDMGQGIAMHAPLQAPQKASIEQVGVTDATQDITKVEVIRIEGNTVHLEVTLATGEVLSETYTYKPGEQ